MFYINSNSTDPSFNLALEQYAFDTLSQNDDVFMLWQNRDAVIVGLHQNTFEEINCGYLEKHNISVVRRLSGGGAVFHDLGNINYTFITRIHDSSVFDFSDSCQPVVDALLAMGLHVEFSGRNDITIGGKKFSGNARYFRDGRLMQHGTLLFDADLDKMAEALRVPDDKLISKGIKSVRSRVTNLRDYLDLTLDEFRSALRKSIACDMPEYILSEQDNMAINIIKHNRYSLWEWNYGKSPEFSIVKRRRLENFGAIRLSMDVNNGIITAFATDGDYFGIRPYSGIADSLRGVKLERDALLHALCTLPLNEYYEGLSANELVNLILE